MSSFSNGHHLPHSPGPEQVCFIPSTRIIILLRLAVRCRSAVVFFGVLLHVPDWDFRRTQHATNFRKSHGFNLLKLWVAEQCLMGCHSVRKWLLTWSVCGANLQGGGRHQNGSPKVSAHEAAQVHDCAHQALHQEQFLRREKPHDCQLPSQESGAEGRDSHSRG